MIRTAAGNGAVASRAEMQGQVIEGRAPSC